MPDADVGVHLHISFILTMTPGGGDIIISIIEKRKQFE